MPILPTKANVITQLEMRRVARLHPAWPVRLVVSVASRQVAA